MIKTFLTGRLGKDAVVNTLESGKKVINYSVAVTIGYGDNASTLWVDCSQWSEKTGLVEYLKRGTQVAVMGEPSIRVYNKNDGTMGASFSLRVDKLDLLGSRSEPASAGSTQQTVTDIPYDDLPF